MTHGSPVWNGASSSQNFASPAQSWNGSQPSLGQSMAATGFQDTALQFGLWMQAQLQQAFMAGYQAGQQASQQAQLGGAWNGFGGTAWVPGSGFGMGPGAGCGSNWTQGINQAWGQGWPQNQTAQFGLVGATPSTSVPSPLSSLFMNGISGESNGRSGAPSRDAA